MLKEITLLFPMVIEDISVYTYMPVKYVVDTDDFSALVNMLNWSSCDYYGKKFTKEEIKFWKIYYNNIDDAYLNPVKKLTKKRLAEVKDLCVRQKAFLDKNLFVRRKVKRNSIVYGFNVFESIIKVGIDTYKVDGYS